MEKQQTKKDSTSLTTNDRITVIAISVVVYALSSFLHEGIGHGGACLLVGCKPTHLSSMHFDGGAEGLSAFAGKLIPAGGPIVSTAVGIMGFALLQHFRRGSGALYFFWWLLSSVNLMQGTGYFLFSGIGGVGDLAAVIKGWNPNWFWRLFLVLIGAVSYYGTVWTMMKTLGPLIGTEQGRVSRARRLGMTAFLAGCLLNLVAGLLNPAGFMLVLLSGIPATMGGTSGLAWGPELLRNPIIAPWEGNIVSVRRSAGWMVAATLIGIAFIVVLGRGLRFG